MTIAACYVCPEGVVLGADSTATFSASSSHGEGIYFDHTQKVLEVGENSSLGIVTAGLGGMRTLAYRTLVARLADRFRTAHPKTVNDAAWQWSSLVWAEYAATFAAERQRFQELEIKGTARTLEEENDLAALRGLGAVFCLGGHCPPDRFPEAYEVWVTPGLTSPWTPVPIPIGTPKFWGWSNLLDRLHFGMDETIFQEILRSGKWTGTQEELVKIALSNRLTPAGWLPIREAIDWVHASIYTTIKAMKFSRLEPVCGGPIEIAVITTDRRFRWVKHKGFDSALAS